MSRNLSGTGFTTTRSLNGTGGLSGVLTELQNLSGDNSGKLLIGKSSGSTMTLANMTDGEAIEVSNGSGSIRLDLSLKKNTAVATSVADSDIFLFADETTGKIVKYIRIDNLLSKYAYSALTGDKSGYLLIGKSDGTMALATLTDGTNITITEGNGTITITNGITNNNQITNGANYIVLGDLSASSPLSYNSSTGAFTTSFKLDSLSATAPLSYNNSTGAFTTSFKLDSISATTPIVYNNSTGAFTFATLTNSNATITSFTGGSSAVITCPTSTGTLALQSAVNTNSDSIADLGNDISAIMALYKYVAIGENTSGGKLLITKTDGTLALATLTDGTNITITEGNGTITITNGITNNNQITNGANYLIADSALLNGVVFVANGGLQVFGTTKASQAGFIDFMEGTDNGVHKCTLKTDASIPASYVVMLPSEAGTLALTSDSQFLWSSAVEAGIRPAQYTKRVLIGKSTYYTPDNSEILQVVGNSIFAGNLEVTGQTISADDWSSMGILYIFGSLLAHDNKELIIGTTSDYKLKYNTTTEHLQLSSLASTNFNFEFSADNFASEKNKWSHYIAYATGNYSLWNRASGATAKYQEYIVSATTVLATKAIPSATNWMATRLGIQSKYETVAGTDLYIGYTGSGVGGGGGEDGKASDTMITLASTGGSAWKCGIRMIQFGDALAQQGYGDGESSQYGGYMNWSDVDYKMHIGYYQASNAENDMINFDRGGTMNLFVRGGKIRFNDDGYGFHGEFYQPNLLEYILSAGKEWGQNFLIIKTHFGSGDYAGIAFQTYDASNQYIYGYDGALYASSCITGCSDDRLKFNEELLPDNTTEILMKLRPQKYEKCSVKDMKTGELDLNNRKIEYGLIAQEVYYEVPELRDLVYVPPSAKLKIIPDDKLKDMNFDDIRNDPDYSDWGKQYAGVKYTELIPFLIKGFQEQQAVIQKQQAIIDKLISSKSFAEFKKKS